MSASEPVVIPARGSARDRNPTKKSARGRPDAARAGRSGDDVYRPDAVPPAVAALLAVTSIPRPQRPAPRRRRAHVAERRGAGSTRPFLDEKGLPDAIHASAPLDLLLSPSEDSDAEIFNPSAKEARAMRTPLASSVRSTSFESVPSLDVDDTSQASLSSPPSPSPGLTERRALSLGRKERPLSSPPAEDCLLDHPLLSKHAALEDEGLPMHAHDRVRGSSPGSNGRLTSPQRSSSSGLKSNLTASLRVLRSAARSFTNFTASSTTVSVIQADDFLTRSILSISPQFTDERRPPSSTLDDDVPTPAQRRYYNPPSGPVSTSTLDDRPPHRFSEPRHLHEVTLRDHDPCTAAIQLQTYNVSRSYHLPRAASTASSSSQSSSTSTSSSSDRPSPPKFTAWQRPISPDNVPIVRSREPRENSDFLRVIVLEMNMRRVGKLSDTAPGKARFILPARKPGERICNNDLSLVPDHAGIQIGCGNDASSADEDGNNDEACRSRRKEKECTTGVAKVTGNANTGGNHVGRTTNRAIPRRWIGVALGC